MSELERLKEALRGRLREYWEMTRGPVPASGQLSCPNKSQHARGDKNPSAHLFEDANGARIKCFGCEKVLDVFSLYQLDHAGASFMDALAGLAELFGLSFPSKVERTRSADKRETTPPIPSRPAVPPPPRRDPKADEYLAQCAGRRDDPTFVSYVTGRGISTETAAALGMGFDPEHSFSRDVKLPAVVFPSAGGWCARSIEGKSHDNMKGASPVWGLEELYPSEPVHATFVVEGQFDRASIVEAGFHAIALGGFRNTTRLVEAVKRKTPTTGLVVLFDNEPDSVTAGKVNQSREKLTEELRAAGAFVFDKIGEDPLGAHDANDALRADRAAFVQRLREIDAAASEAYVLRDAESETADGYDGVIISASQFPPPVPETENPRAVFRNGYLRKGQVLTLFSVAGVGKSVISNQCAVAWARGVRDVIGLEPLRPLRVLVVQFEDDLEEMGEFFVDYRKGYRLEGWTDAELDQAFGSLHYADVRKLRTERRLELVDEALVEFLRDVQRARHYDVVVLNPLTSAMSEYDLSDNHEANDYLRHKLEPVMTDPETEFALVLVHHTNKATNPEQRKSKASAGAFAQYDAAGSAALMNWTRASLMIWPTAERTAFELVGAKRWTRLGWTDGEGKPTPKKFISYSSGIKFWIPTPEDVVARLESAEDAKTPKAATDPKADADLVARNLRESPSAFGATEARELAKRLTTSRRGNAAFDLIRADPKLYRVAYRKDGRFEYYGGPAELDLPPREASDVPSDDPLDFCL